MMIKIPKMSLVLLIGPSGSGKSTFAKTHFRGTEILSSDVCRGMISDDENDQSVTNQAFALLHYLVAQRLALGRLTVVDATNVQKESRKPLLELARQYHVMAVGIVFDLPGKICQERNAARTDRTFGPHVIRTQIRQMRESLRDLKHEGFRYQFTLDSPEAVQSVTIERTPLWTDRTSETGPFDMIGDVHGCCDELEKLLELLGYRRVPRYRETSAEEIAPDVRLRDERIWGECVYEHPEGRKAVFVGDLVDRGPRSADVLRLVRNMVQRNSALCVPGNHDVKLVKKLRGANVKLQHGLEQTMAELDNLALPPTDAALFRSEIADFLDRLVSHCVLDGGRLVAAHAGMKAEMQGRASGKVREFALYGETTGETDEFGLPVRHRWAMDYRGRALVVYGHTPVPMPDWLNNTVNIDTGAVFGGKLTALRYPEKEIVSVPAAREYCSPARPLHAPVVYGAHPSGAEQAGLSSQQVHDLMLDIDDVLGKRVIETRWRGKITVREAHAAAALEVMSRFAVDPRWLIHLPPTMSPCATSQRDGYLEHPDEAFSYYHKEGISDIVCEQKHMGSRAIVVLCRTPAVAKERFGVTDKDGAIGAIYTRTGRPFFTDPAVNAEILVRMRDAAESADLWTLLGTDWLCLDGEMLPWSAKAQELLKSQYAAVAAAGLAALPPVLDGLREAAARLSDADRAACQAVSERFQNMGDHVGAFRNAYRHYCWNVRSVDDWKFAPFHILAGEGKAYHDHEHSWHLSTLAALARVEPRLFLETPALFLDLNDPSQWEQGIAWWENHTATGGEGMVVKPRTYLVQGQRGLLQPAVKCRGREYLRIIYGPDYTHPPHLETLRRRGLGHKRALALSELALGLEALERFVNRAPLRLVHECVFGVLALESEPVDPRL